MAFRTARPCRTSHQFVLDFTQEGILRKDDLFKVVFDPGADKREKRVPGQIVPRVALLRAFAPQTYLFALRI
jgi:hypothetical protein